MLDAKLAALPARATRLARTKRRPPRHRTVVPHLFGAWPHVSERLRAGCLLVLFLDFDGTLVPFAARPEDAWPTPGARRALRQLVRHGMVRVIILSGRRRADLMKRLGVTGVRYLGVYGWERGAGAWLALEMQALLDKFRAAVLPQLRKLPGVHSEDKGFSFTIHFRSATPAMAGRASRIVRKSIREVAPALRVVDGDKVWEIVPPQVESKGAAIRKVLKAIRQPCLVIYAGDAVTDEEGFRTLKNGITIHVGRARPTHARYRLRNPREVQMFLARLAEVLS